jgi:small-conductance mechanosensitive channel
MYISGALLLSRLASWVADRVNRGVERRAGPADALTRSEEAKHRHAVIGVVTWTFLVLVYSVTGVLVVQRLGIPVTSLVAPATVAGVAIGFGAQRIVQDVLAGFFIVAERQYGFGDVVRMAPIGTTTGVMGTVEEVTLRITRLRTASGEVVTVPNGQITQVTNLSRDWARAVIDVPVASTSDISEVNRVLHDVGEAAFADPDLRPLLLDVPTVMGVENLDVDHFTVRVVARTLPGRQFEASRALRVRIVLGLRQAGVTVPQEPAPEDAEPEP